MEPALADRLCNRLAESAGAGWAYATGLRPAAEPTAWACVSLTAYRRAPDAVESGLHFLAELQLGSGAVPAADDLQHATWPTALAALAWSANPKRTDDQFDEPRRRALDWLLETRGLTFVSDPHIYGHNTTLSAWPWIDKTHTWVEPTGYGLMALRTTRRASHPRFVEGAQVLRDRAIPGGGWNYGNPRMFGATLRPFPATTGIALVALADQPRDEVIEDALSYLERELPTIRAPASLAWGVMALTVWNKRPRQADEWLAESAARLFESRPQPLEESLLLLALRENAALDEISADGEAQVISHA